MRNLTGLPVPPPHGRREYQSLPGEGSDEQQSLSNPFSEGDNSIGDETSSSNQSDSMRHSKLASGANSTRAFTPSLMPSSDYDRYPNNLTANANSRYSQSTFSGDGRSRTNSMSSYDESNPFLIHGTSADFSPFGGYPASDFPLHMDEKEADDYLHNPDPIKDAAMDRRCQRPDQRGFWNVLAFVILVCGMLTVFIVLPVLAFTGVTERDQPKYGDDGPVNVTSLLSPYKYGTLSAIRTSLIDDDTPEEAKTFTSRNGDKWELVFSDEFEVEGRTFYDGDDQFWTSVDIHYAATQDLEWYDPDAATTKNGVLQLRLDAFRNHNLNYRSGMVQSWNKFCFTQGYVEIGARLPGNGSIPGFWPGLWTLGNLGRPGYLATTDGLWPYAYNECDAGITPNQSSYDGISYLGGQRLNKCTCPNTDHPNPGTGRGAPEIDIIEGTVDTTYSGNGEVSQSLQVAPMDIWYMVDYKYIEVYNSSITKMNSWSGGPLQQAISGVSYLNNDWYEKSEASAFQSYAIEYTNDDLEGYISWYVGKNPVYTMFAPALGPNGNVGTRQISKEPMTIIMNLGFSTSWTYIAWLDLEFPATMEIDYVRVYQPPNNKSTTCDPDGYPTKQYIEDHINAYTNPNLTSWSMAGWALPENEIMHGCN